MRPQIYPDKEKDALFTLLDANYDKYYPGQTFWRELHALDEEITPGNIYVEPFKSNTTKKLVGGGLSPSDMYCEGEQTVVIRLRRPQTARTGANLLNKIFAGSGTTFIAEVGHGKDGKETYEIRSNIDKRHWGKLGVFCRYRFEREIPEAEQDKLQADCQKVVDNFTQGTGVKWDAVTGMPAFVAIMGMHGILRPKEHYKPNVRRKNEELNGAHQRGLPRLFEGIVIHVKLKKSGEVSGVPYKWGYDVNRHALQDANEGALGHLLLEMLGGNPIQGKWPNRIVGGTSLLCGIVGMATGNPEVLLIGSLGGATWVVSYVGHRWYKHKNLENRAEMRRRQAKIQKCVDNGIAPAEIPGIAKDKDTTPSQIIEAIKEQQRQPLDLSNIHAAYGADVDQQVVSTVNEAFSGEPLKALERIINEGKNPSFTDAAANPTVPGRNR